MAELIDFNNGRKNNNRRRIWNEITKRIFKDKKNSLVVYLPGPDDLDRKVALERGFSADNLIGLEIDKNIFSELRKNGKLVVHGNFFDVISSWPSEKLPDVIYIDKLGGFTRDVDDLLTVLFSNKFINKEIVIAINMMHGRDKFSNYFRESEIKAVKHCIEYGVKHESIELIGHRGKAAITAIKCILDYYYHSFGLSTFYFHRYFNESFNPVYGQYKSGKALKYDWVVFTKPAMNESGYVINGLPIRNKLKRRLSALLAIRTMRINGKLPHCARI